MIPRTRPRPGVLYREAAGHLSWQDHGKCAETDPELFFPEKGGSPKEALAICGSCPVSNLCRDYAVRRPGLWGIWGGTTEGERKRIRRVLGAAVPAEAAA